MSIDGCTSKALRDVGVMPLYHLVVSYRAERHINIIWWLCIARQNDSIKTGVDATVTTT